jgi:hypothetical protein
MSAEQKFICPINRANCCATICVYIVCVCRGAYARVYRALDCIWDEASEASKLVSQTSCERLCIEMLTSFRLLKWELNRPDMKSLFLFLDDSASHPLGSATQYTFDLSTSHIVPDLDRGSTFLLISTLGWKTTVVYSQLSQKDFLTFPVQLDLTKRIAQFFCQHVDSTNLPLSIDLIRRPLVVCYTFPN